MVSYWGHFSEPGYLRPGERCASPDSQAPFHNPAALKAGSGNRRGKGNDATFFPFQRLFVGDSSEDAAARLVTKASNAEGVSLPSLPFKPVSPMKRATPQAGAFYGTISGAISYVPHGERRLRKGEHVLQKRGVFTAPTKRGGFGYNKTTLSELQGHKGVTGEYEYIPDPFQEQRQPRQSGGDGRVPFRPPRLVSDACFALYEHKPQGGPLPLGNRNLVLMGPAFRPVFAGRMDAFGPLPEYIPCPCEPQSVRHVL